MATVAVYQAQYQQVVKGLRGVLRGVELHQHGRRACGMGQHTGQQHAGAQQMLQWPHVGTGLRPQCQPVEGAGAARVQCGIGRAASVLVAVQRGNSRKKQAKRHHHHAAPGWKKQLRFLASSQRRFRLACQCEQHAAPGLQEQGAGQVGAVGVGLLQLPGRKCPGFHRYVGKTGLAQRVNGSTQRAMVVLRHRLADAAQRAGVLRQRGFQLAQRGAN